MNPVSLNNRLLVQAYSGDRTLKAEVKNGFASISQKVNLVGLKVLGDCYLAWGTTCQYVQKGATAYIREEFLFSQPWAKQTFESESIEGKFMIVDSIYVEYVVPQ